MHSQTSCPDQSVERMWKKEQAERQPRKQREREGGRDRETDRRGVAFCMIKI